jgi:uncharacterized membrane protein YkoI
MQNGPMMKTILAVMAALVLTAPAVMSPAWADSSSSSSSSSSTNGRTTTRSSNSNSNHRDDQDDARDALRQGKVMSLTAILEIAAKRERGTVLEVELETDDGIPIYKIDLLSEAGRKVRMRLNARNGEILTVDYR